MANITRNITVDLDSKRIVRENNPNVGQRIYSFAEGSVYAGSVALLQAGETVDGDLLTALTIEVGNAPNDIALVRHDGTDNTYSLSFNGELLRQYLYDAGSKQAVFNVALTVDGVRYVLESVSCALVANPDDNTGNLSVSWDDVTGKPVPYRLELVARPAGSNLIAEGSHSVGDQDTDLAGWLNTGEGDPDGYAFKYNISQDNALAALFPPSVSNLSQARLEVNGFIYNQPLVLINEDGIFWKDNALGFAPWPVDYVSPEDEGEDVNALSLFLDFVV